MANTDLESRCSALGAALGVDMPTPEQLAAGRLEDVRAAVRRAGAVLCRCSSWDMAGHCTGCGWTTGRA